MKINPESYVAQAETWLDEFVGDMNNFQPDPVIGQTHALLKLDAADTLIQLEVAKQLGRIAVSLDRLVTMMRR